MRETDICILGAGPGGATAALHLANAGQRCLLLDRATFPRDKICGDALSGKVVSELRRIDENLPARLAADATQLPAWGIDFFAPNGRRLGIPFKPNFNKATDPAAGHIAKRIDFDNFLVEEVRQRPEIELLEGVDIAHHERTPDGRWHLRTADGAIEIKAKLLLVANGAQSAFARQIGGHAAGARPPLCGPAGVLPGRNGLEQRQLY